VLLIAPGPIDRDRVALLGDRHLQGDRPADIDAVIVDMVEEIVDSVR
jgi:hypothetical protein